MLTKPRSKKLDKSEIGPGEVEAFASGFEKLREQVARRIVGNTEVVQQVLTAIFAGGHVLLEGVPGLGKTLMVRTISDALHLEFHRIQFTPDLMPADITGTNILSENSQGERGFRFQKGPIFANLILADEVNRATPKTQSAILEAMQDRSVSVGGTTHALPTPFCVLATQNPIEMEGTYPLPEAQVDRFLFKVDVKPQGEEELMGVIQRTTGDEEIEVERVMDPEQIARLQLTVRQVLVAEFVQRYAARLVLGTHPQSPYATTMTNQFVRFGASPRGVQSLIMAAKVQALLDGRYNVSCEDIAKVARPALRHRIIRNFEAEADGITQGAILDELLASVAEPAAV